MDGWLDRWGDKWMDDRWTMDGLMDGWVERWGASGISIAH